MTMVSVDIQFPPTFATVNVNNWPYIGEPPEPVFPPTASLSVTPTSGNAPLNVTANASNSWPGSNLIATYTFNFGDGTIVGPQAQASATHTYSTAGTKTITVTVTDAIGMTATDSKNVTVSAPIPVDPPTAALSVNPTSGPTPLTITANASGSIQGANPISTYKFSWGDGSADTTQSGHTATHTYTTAGNRTVTVTVTDTASRTGTATQNVNVTAPAVPPTAALSASPQSGASPLLVTANASGSIPGTNQIASYEFDWGDGTKTGPQAGATATHTFTKST